MFILKRRYDIRYYRQNQSVAINEYHKYHSDLRVRKNKNKSIQTQHTIAQDDSLTITLSDLRGSEFLLQDMKKNIQIQHVLLPLWRTMTTYRSHH